MTDGIDVSNLEVEHFFREGVADGSPSKDFSFSVSPSAKVSGWLKL